MFLLKAWNLVKVGVNVNSFIYSCLQVTHSLDYEELKYLCKMT